MPRYTDLDRLIDKVEETTWYHINKNGELVMGANSETDIPLYKHSDIKRVLAQAPIADAVPDSEVEALQEALSKAEADVKNYMKVAEYQQSLSVKRYHEIKRLKEDIDRLQDINHSQVEDGE